MVKIIYARQPAPVQEPISIFLAGPTPRSVNVPTWRKQATKILEDFEFSGTVFVPENENGIWDESTKYDDQLYWESHCLTIAKCIAFWVPRDLETLPGWTTNIEFGEWKNSGKVVLGYPHSAPKMKAYDFWARQLRIPVSDTLRGTLNLAMEMVGVDT